jgi:protein subunit release factor A
VRRHQTRAYICVYARVVVLLRVRSLPSAQSTANAQSTHPCQQPPQTRAHREAIAELERAVLRRLLPREDEGDEDRGLILEVRAGTGGDEASLFAGEVFGMYEKLARRQQWRFEVLSSSKNEFGGLKEAAAAVQGHRAYPSLKVSRSVGRSVGRYEFGLVVSARLLVGRCVHVRMHACTLGIYTHFSATAPQFTHPHTLPHILPPQYESGVHRVQRVPVNDSRLHTSAATVAVLPEPEEVDFKLEQRDLKFDVFRASGAGGQHVNTTESAVRCVWVCVCFIYLFFKKWE